MATGFGHTLALTSSGNLYTWGKNDYGELGLGNNSQKYTPQLIPGIKINFYSSLKELQDRLLLLQRKSDDAIPWDVDPQNYILRYRKPAP